MNHDELNMCLDVAHLDEFFVELNKCYSEFCFAIRRKKNRSIVLEIAIRALNLIKNNLEKINDFPEVDKYMVLNFVNAIKYETNSRSISRGLKNSILTAYQVAKSGEYQKLKSDVDKLKSR